MHPRVPAAVPRPVFLLIAVAYLYAFPFFAGLRSANELPRVLTTQEIVERGTFRLDARMGELGSRFDIAPTKDGHYYQNKAPGPSILAVPTYVVLKLLGFTSVKVSTWAFRVTVVTIPALIFLWFFLRLSTRFSPDVTAGRTALAAYAFGSPALPYGVLFMSHQPAAVCAGGAFVAAVTLVRADHVRRRPLVAAAVGLLGGLSVMMDYQSFIAAGLVGLYLVLFSRRRIHDGALAIAGTVPPGLALAAYHTVCFGGPMKTGYALSNPVHEQGFLGLVGPSWDSFWHTLFDPSNGLLILMPWCVLAVVGAVAVLVQREQRRAIGAEVCVCVLLVAAYLLFMGSLIPSFSRAGWCVGPRYMTVAMPFLAWLAIPGFAVAGRWLATRFLAQALVVSACVVFVAAATTYPHWPEQLRNPVYELSFRLLRNGYAVHSLGTWIGLRGIWSLLPLYVLVVGLVLWLMASPTRPRHRYATVAALALGGVLIMGLGRFPLTGPYADQAYRFVTSTWEPLPRAPVPKR